MRQFDHIRTVHLDINEAVGNSLAIFNNKRRKNNTVTFEDMQIVNNADQFFCILVYSYEDDTPAAPNPPTARRWIGQPLDEPQTDAPIARKRFISQDHSDE